MRNLFKHIHFVGIGGIGMSGIAEVLLHLGFSVSGSDIKESSRLDHLRKSGATVHINHYRENVSGADLIVISSAVSNQNDEVRAAEELRIPIVHRAKILAELMRCKKGIAVAGTHGKTTTTGLISSILIDGLMDPTFIVGGILNSVQVNARWGSGEYLVAEADESDASFLCLYPQIAVVTNIDMDHMQTYQGSVEKLKKAYLNFIHNVPLYGGLAILGFEDPVVAEIALLVRKPILSYGFSKNVDCRAINVTQKGMDSYFEVEYFGHNIGEYKVPLPGKHNVLNALVAVSIGKKLTLSNEVIRNALSTFEGMNRRFQQMGLISINDRVIELVDDYAHHPKEIEMTLYAIRNCWPNRRIITVFQPHRYSRTRELFNNFTDILSSVDHLIITEVYAAGETAISGVDGRSLCEAIQRRGNKPIFVENFCKLYDLLSCMLKDSDVLITLGAGNIGNFSRELSVMSGIHRSERVQR